MTNSDYKQRDKYVGNDYLVRFTFHYSNVNNYCLIIKHHYELILNFNLQEFLVANALVTWKLFGECYLFKKKLYICAH